MDLLMELEGAKTIAIAGHIRPDGDCVGSVTSVYQYLKKTMPEAKIVPMIETPPAKLLRVPAVDELCTDFNPELSEFDVFIGVDSSTTDRYGDALKFYESAKKRIIIDHHISNDGFGDVSLVDGTASSTCEIIYDLFNKEYIDENIAISLYVGIMDDTGVFQYSSVKPKTLRIVADLIEFGFDFNELIDSIFYTKTRLQNEMLGRGLVESIIFNDGKCIVSKIDKKTMDFYGALPSDLDGIVNQLKYTKGVEVSIFMYEIEPLKYKISMRSNGNVDVAKIAKFYNGGGHVRAAGLTMEGTFHDCINILSDSINIQLEK